MKQLLTFIVCIALLCSCGASKKTTTATHTNTDSTGTKTSSLSQEKKKDSTGTNTTQATEKTTTEKGYKKTTTTVKEYFAGRPVRASEFPDKDNPGEDTTTASGSHGVGKIICPDPKTQKPGKFPVYRETTIVEEEGSEHSVKDAALTNSSTGQISAADRLKEDQSEGANKKSTGETNRSWQINLSLLPWWVWVAVGFCVFLFIGFKMKI